MDIGPATNEPDYGVRTTLGLVTMADRSAIRIPSANLAGARARPSASARIWISIIFAFIIVSGFLILLSYFTSLEKNVNESLRETFPSNISLEHFKTVYFPHPGCVAEGVSFRTSASPAGSRPVVTIQKLTIQGSYADFIFRPHHISRVYLEGLRLQVPPLKNTGAFTGGYSDSQMTIGEVVANGAVLEFESANGEPATRFDIHELSLGTVSAKDGMSYRLAMKNPTPTGAI